MLVLTAIFLFAASADAAAPDPCAHVPIQKDAFAGTWRGDTFEVLGPYGGEVTLRQDAAATLLVAAFHVDGAASAVLVAGSTVKIALYDGSVLQLPTVKNAAPAARIDAASALILTEYVVSLAVDADALAKLSASPLKAMQLDVGGQQAYRVFLAGFGKKVQGVAACLATPKP